MTSLILTMPITMNDQSTVNPFAVAVALLIEGPWTLLVVAPHPRCDDSAMQILLQISIALAGNYNFFNLLTVGAVLNVEHQYNAATSRVGKATDRLECSRWDVIAMIFKA